MSHRLRVVLALCGLVAATVAFTWFLAGYVVLRPLIAALGAERIETALYVAREVETAADPPARAWTLGQELGVGIDPVREAPPEGSRGRAFARDERVLRLSTDPAVPLLVPLEGVDGVWGLSIRWPVDIERPRHVAAGGFALVAVAVVLAAFAASRWVLGPLGATSRAMERVAGGDLDARVPEGDDDAGRMGATFNRMAERVGAMVRGQRRLMAGLSHEIRSPLARMRLATELLKDDGAPAGRVEALERDIATIDGLVGELLESARMEEGAIGLHRVPIEVGPLLREALGAADLEGRPADVAAPDGLVVLADRTRLLRAVGNLLSNAARHTPPGTRVRLAASRVDGGVRLMVEDDGPGVPAAELPRLFEPFYQADGRLHAGGLGLGLMLVRQIAEAHGGRVEARNGGGTLRGLSVAVTLPAA